MNSYLSTALTNIFICLAVIVGVYITKSAWCLWGLMFIHGISFNNNNETEEETEEENTETEA